MCLTLKWQYIFILTCNQIITDTGSIKITFIVSDIEVLIRTLTYWYIIIIL